MIIYSAIKNLKNNKIYLGKNHSEIFSKIPKLKEDNRSLIMGFLTDKLKFLDRKEASNYVIKNNQIKNKKIIKLIKNQELFSEHLLLELYGLLLWKEYKE